MLVGIALRAAHRLRHIIYPGRRDVRSEVSRHYAFFTGKPRKRDADLGYKAADIDARCDNNAAKRHLDLGTMSRFLAAITLFPGKHVHSRPGIQ